MIIVSWILFVLAVLVAVPAQVGMYIAETLGEWSDDIWEKTR